jgi:hypothetical protein
MTSDPVRLSAEWRQAAKKAHTAKRRYLWAANLMLECKQEFHDAEKHERAALAAMTDAMAAARCTSHVFELNKELGEMECIQCAALQRTWRRAETEKHA